MPLPRRIILAALVALLAAPAIAVEPATEAKPPASEKKAETKKIDKEKADKEKAAGKGDPSKKDADKKPVKGELKRTPIKYEGC